MTLGQWYVRRGRISRRVYWLHYVVPIAVLTLVAGVVDGALGYPGLTGTATDSGGFYAATGGPVSTLATLATLVPSISSSVTRLHDRDHSAWWLLWLLLPIIGWLVLLVQNGFLRGTPGANQYGPPADRHVGDPAGV